MNQPPWYAEWRHDAVHALMRKNANLRIQFRLGSLPRFDYDLADARLVFSDQGKPVVTADIQMVGSIVTNQNWLWAWANNWGYESAVQDAKTARRFGEEHGIAELTTDILEDESLENLGWELSAVVTRITSAKGVYRVPTEQGYLFLIYRDIRFVS